MQKYVCSICGFIYDEETGYEKDGISPKTKWEDVPDDWACPLCGASKSEFNLQDQNKEEKEEAYITKEENEPLRELSDSEISILCSNLAKGCEKQYKEEEALLFNELADYYKSKGVDEPESDFFNLLKLMEEDLNSGYKNANLKATALKDRGSMRALTWNEKVTRILYSLLKRYQDQGDKIIENNNIYVCEICGFVYIGDEAPEICPVCKVPSLKITKIPKEVL